MLWQVAFFSLERQLQDHFLKDLGMLLQVLWELLAHLEVNLCGNVSWYMGYHVFHERSLTLFPHYWFAICEHLTLILELHPIASIPQFISDSILLNFNPLRNQRQLDHYVFL